MIRTRALIIATQLFTNQVSAQAVASDNNACVHKGNLSASLRAMKYPLNRAKRVQLVSFTGGPVKLPNGVLTAITEIPKKNGKIDYKRLREIKTLSVTQVDKLTDILYNYGLAKGEHNILLLKCYMPRNAIIFLDEKGKTFEYIEICFECRRIEKSSNKIDTGDWCSDKIFMLAGFFKKAVIKYGVTKW